MTFLDFWVSVAFIKQHSGEREEGCSKGSRISSAWSLRLVAFSCELNLSLNLSL